jgi:hypothetical protein
MWQAGFSGPNSPAPQTQGYGKRQSADGDSIHYLLSHDAELLAAQTRLFQTRSSFPAEPLPELATLHNLLAENEKTFLTSLQSLYSATLSLLAQPNSDSGALAAAKQDRARLVVLTQKAHLRRASPSEIMALHEKLRAVEDEVFDLEHRGVEQMLEQRLNEELDALEKRARGELRVVEMLRRRRRTESWRAEAEAGLGYESEVEAEQELAQGRESEPQSSFSPITPYTEAATEPAPEPKVEVEVKIENLPPLPVSTVDEELLLASAPFIPFPKPSAASSRLASLQTPKLTISTGSPTPPPRPIFSPSLPPEFMSLPVIVTQSPSPTSGFKPPIYRGATFSSSPLSVCAYPDIDSTVFSSNPIPAAREVACEEGKVAEEPEASPDEGREDAEIGIGSPVLCTRVNGVPMTMI